MMKYIFLMAIIFLSCTQKRKKDTTLTDFETINQRLEKTITKNTRIELMQLVNSKKNIDTTLLAINKAIDFYIDAVTNLKNNLLKQESDNLDYTYSYLQKQQRFEFIYNEANNINDAMLTFSKQHQLSTDSLQLKILSATNFNNFKNKNFVLIPTIAGATLLSIITNTVENNFIIMLKKYAFK